MNLHIAYQAPSTIMLSQNVSITKYSLVKSICLGIMKGKGYIMGGNVSTRGGKTIPVIFARDLELMICSHILAKVGFTRS